MPLSELIRALSFLREVRGQTTLIKVFQSCFIDFDKASIQHKSVNNPHRNFRVGKLQINQAVFYYQWLEGIDKTDTYQHRVSDRQ